MKIERVLTWLDHAGPDLTLVGGQAVALWEHLLGLRGHTFFVLHPIDCLASRLANVALIPGKRTPRGYDQLRAVIRVCLAYIRGLIADGKSGEAIRIANRIFDLAVTDAGKRVFLQQGIDLLEGIPAPEHFAVEAFARENHPRQVARVQDQRKRFVRLLERLGATKTEAVQDENAVIPSDDEPPGKP